MNCLKCSIPLKEVITYKKSLFSYYKVYTSFCLNCDFNKKVVIQITKEEYLNDLEIKKLKISNSTFKSYNQTIKK
jgi:hypothetical protein